ncbi:MAG: hypothetical protein PHH83_01445 [Patescibacteria group bacterium]|nr:hypothetical protein [Patescibacteria group bacterium]
MLKSLKVGMGFGLTSATITTLGLMIGLASSTGSKLAIIGGIITIAIADSCSDALGVHIAKESEGNFSKKQIWQVTVSTFLFKAMFACTYLIPIILFSIKTAIIVSILWGLIILFMLSYKLAKNEKQKPFNVIGEHLLIAIIVMISTYCLGSLISIYFK